MRLPLLAGCTALCVLPQLASGQRLSQLAPGTFVRITTRDRVVLIGPLAEVRADSVVLSSYDAKPGVTLPVSGIERYEYADGKESGHGLLGALVGGGIGAGLMRLGRRKDDNLDGCMALCIPAQVLVVIGAGIGYAIGNADAPAHWVLPTSDRSALPRPVLGPSRIGVSFRF